MEGDRKVGSLFGTKKLVVYTDGGARGNPGPAAIGVVVGGKHYDEYCGVKTNNQAEYLAVIFALKKVRQLGGRKNTKQTEVEVRMDSELVARQLSGKYKILEPDLQLLFVEVWNLKFDFKKITFKHIPREENRTADMLANRALDERKN